MKNRRFGILSVKFLFDCLSISVLQKRVFFNNDGHKKGKVTLVGYWRLHGVSKGYMQSHETFERLVTSENTEGALALSKWLRETGVDNVTGWRWRKKGWLETFNISGRVYVSRTAIREFLKRAEDGEFSQPVRGAALKSAEARRAKEAKGAQ